MKIKFESCDGEIITVERDLIHHSGTLKEMFENLNLDERSDELTNPISLSDPNITKDILKKIFVWCKYYSQITSDSSAELSHWDKQFFSCVDLYKIIMAANYLAIESLLNKACKLAANQIHGKTPKQICEVFNIVCDITEEDLAEINKSSPWTDELLSSASESKN